MFGCSLTFSVVVATIVTVFALISAVEFLLQITLILGLEIIHRCIVCIDCSIIREVPEALILCYAINKLMAGAL